MTKKAKKKPNLLTKDFTSLDEAAEFWDTHDSADYEKYMREVVCEVNIARRTFISSDEDLAQQVKR